MLYTRCKQCCKRPQGLVTVCLNAQIDTNIYSNDKAFGIFIRGSHNDCIGGQGGGREETLGDRRQGDLEDHNHEVGDEDDVGRREHGRKEMRYRHMAGKHGTPRKWMPFRIEADSRRNKWANGTRIIERVGFSLCNVRVKTSKGPEVSVSAIEYCGFITGKIEVLMREVSMALYGTLSWRTRECLKKQVLVQSSRVGAE